MDQAFVPVKTSKLIVRVKLDADSHLPAEPEHEVETVFNRRALFAVGFIVLLLAVVGYYFSTSNDAEISADIEVESLAIEELVASPLVSVIETQPIGEAISESPSALTIEAAEPEVVVEEPQEILTPVAEILPELKAVVEVAPEVTAVPDFSANVSRAQFTYGIKQREPIDLVVDVVPVKTNAIEQLYFFTELIKLKGQAISHQWFHEGKLISEIKFNVRGNRWRVNSSKRLGQASIGQWDVKVVNEVGEVLTSKSFEYQ